MPAMAAENAWRTVSLGRQDYLFFGSDHGGDRGALLYGLVGSCRLNGIDPKHYLHHVLTVIADWPLSRVSELLLRRVILPGGSVAVWYASDSALTAAAEAYGRLYHLKGTKSYPESVLSQHYMCSVDVMKTVKVIDVVALCELLHIPLDSLENEDYTFTQWLMEHLYTHFGRDYDGIAYTSRHKRYKRCYAFWERPGITPAFTDTPQGMAPYASYVETDKGMFPKWWHKGMMSGEEMFEELPGFEITPEPM